MISIVPIRGALDSSIAGAGCCLHLASGGSVQVPHCDLESARFAGQGADGGPSVASIARRHKKSVAGCDEEADEDDDLRIHCSHGQERNLVSNSLDSHFEVQGSFLLLFFFLLYSLKCLPCTSSSFEHFAFSICCLYYFDRAPS